MLYFSHKNTIDKNLFVDALKCDGSEYRVQEMRILKSLRERTTEMIGVSRSSSMLSVRDSLKDPLIENLQEINLTDDHKVNLRKMKKGLSKTPTGGSSSWSNITSLEYKEVDPKQKRHSSIFSTDCMKSKNLKSRYRRSLDVLSREFSKIPVHTKQRSIATDHLLHTSRIDVSSYQMSNTNSDNSESQAENIDKTPHSTDAEDSVFKKIQSLRIEQRRNSLLPVPVKVSG